MSRTLTSLFLAITLFSFHPSFAQFHYSSQDFPMVPGLSKAANKQLDEKLKLFMSAGPHNGGSLLKTTSGNERLVAESDYDYTLPVGSQLADSLRIIYSAARSSSYNFDVLNYNYGDNSDFPGFFGDGGFVHFDTLLRYAPPSPAVPVLAGLRIYDASGRVIRAVQPKGHILFVDYNSSGQIIKTTIANYNGSSYDSSVRDFYFYDAAGYVIKDSSEQWQISSMSWDLGVIGEYSYNAAGFPTRFSAKSALGSTPVFQFDITYNANNDRTRTILKFYSGGTYVNTEKDTLTYTNSMLTFYDTYNWSPSANGWILASQERRHLNAASLPDSAWSRTITSSVADTIILKLAYNIQGNPIYARSYTGTTSTPNSETRYYYGPNNVGVGVGGVGLAKNLAVYPNPANDLLNFSDVLNGRFNILNAAGQLVSDGVLKASSAIPVKMLPPGFYTLHIQDSQGEVYLAKFIRQ